MKKYFNVSLCYAIAAMVAGVFYREFTKAMGFTGPTTLLRVHPHQCGVDTSTPVAAQGLCRSQRSITFA